MHTELLKDLCDIYGMAYVPWWQRQSTYYIVAGILGLLVGYLLWRLIRYYLTKKHTLTAWDAAFKTLKLLNSEEYMKPDKAKLWYSTLTDTLKKYLHDRYDYALDGKTDQELLAFLDAQHDFPKTIMVPLQEILDHASSVKFANEIGLAQRMQRDIIRARECIQETVPVDDTTSSR